MMRTITVLNPSGDILGNRLRQRAIRRALAHGALLLIPFTWALVTWLR